jgi:hypothetical protein
MASNKEIEAREVGDSDHELSQPTTVTRFARFSFVSCGFPGVPLRFTPGFMLPPLRGFKIAGAVFFVSFPTPNSRHLYPFATNIFSTHAKYNVASLGTTFAHRRVIIS